MIHFAKYLMMKTLYKNRMLLNAYKTSVVFLSVIDVSLDHDTVNPCLLRRGRFDGSKMWPFWGINRVMS